jgi:anti-sigma regulatory factor (Ser/Thr protein kinase)
MTGDIVQDVAFPDCEGSHVGELHLMLNCNSDCIHVLRAMVAVMAARVGMDKIRSNRAAVAVDELFANISAHAYGGKPGRLEFETRVREQKNGRKELIFKFRDYASRDWNGNFSDDKDVAPDCGEPVKPGGLGLKLIHSVADSCEYEVFENGNQWRLCFVLQRHNETRE